MSLDPQQTNQHPAPLPAAHPGEIARIQANLTAHFRLFAHLPGVTFVEDAEVTWIASQGVPGSFVLRTAIRQPPIEQRIGQLLRQLGQQTHALDWFVFPSCQPADLGERLAAYGQAGGPDGAWTLVGTIGGPGGTWMLCDLMVLPSPPSVSPAFHVEQVQTEAMLAEWVRVSLTGFGQEPPLPEQMAINPFYRAYADHGVGPDARSLHYIGYLDDQPVTAATLLLAGDIAGLFDISTPPVYRRQGFGSAISWAMLAAAQKQGYRLAYVWSSNMGRTVYPRAGFVPVDIGMREYSWQRR